MSSAPDARPRILALDVARGIAILGTLATNIWIVSHPGGMLGYLTHPTTPGASAAWQTAEAVLMALANGKFLGLLTLMFGIGMVIQAESAAGRGRRWGSGHGVRMGLLFLEGLLHFLLIAEFDVLMGYAVTGALVAFVVLRGPRVRLAWAVATGGVHLLLVTAATALLLAAGGIQETSAGVGSVYQSGSWLDLVVMRLDHALLFRIEPIFIGCLTFAMFLAGAELHRRGLFEDRGGRLRRRLMVIGAVALVADLTLALTEPATILVSRYVLAPLVATGLLALIAGLGRDGGGLLGGLVSPVGRTALSCYVGQNLLSTALFHGWGFGLNAVDPDARALVTIGVYLGVSVLMVWASRWWLDRCSRGPVEAAAHAAYRMLMSVVECPDGTSHDGGAEGRSRPGKTPSVC